MPFGNCGVQCCWSSGLRDPHMGPISIVRAANAAEESLCISNGDQQGILLKPGHTYRVTLSSQKCLVLCSPACRLLWAAGATIGSVSGERPAEMASEGPRGMAAGAADSGAGSGRPAATAAAEAQSSVGVAACSSPSLARIRKSSSAQDGNHVNLCMWIAKSLFPQMCSLRTHAHG